MKILFVLPRFPWPLEKGDKLRAYHFIRELSARHEVHLFSLSDIRVTDEDLEALKPFCQSITIEHLRLLDRLLGFLYALLFRKPMQVGYFRKPSAIRKVRKLDRELQPDVVFCQMVRVVPYITNLKRFRVLDYQDALSRNMERRAGASPFPMNLMWQRESRLLQKYEAEVFDAFHLKCMISAADRDHIQHSNAMEVVVVPNGVDFDHFIQQTTKESGSYDLVFTGNMAYAPNVQGAIWLARTILPMIQEKIPTARLLLAGASPTAAVKALAGPSVTVSGWMDDIRDAYRSGKVFIAPMQTGSGLQNKLLEAMAMGLPCITTPLANAAIGAAPALEIMVSDDAEGLAQCAVVLLQDQALADEIAGAGHRMVMSRFRWASHIQSFETALIDAMKRDHRR